MITKKQRIEIGKKAMQSRWGLRVLMSIFPTKDGKHRVTLCYKGKEYVFGGENRVKVMSEAFAKWGQLIDANL